MKHAWKDDRFSALLRIDSVDELFDEVARAAQSLGFEYCAYGIRMPLPVSRPKVAMFSNYSPQWQERYLSCGYLQVDPTVQHAFRSILPVVWSDTLFKPARAMWEEARSHDLRVGWAQPTHDANGAVGLLTFARGSEQLSETELSANEARMSWLAHYTHAAMARLLTPTLAPEIRVALTSREKEVLRWTAEGKTTHEIARILLIAESTVNFHINNVIAKLDTANKTQAAVKATALGMLS